MVCAHQSTHRETSILSLSESSRVIPLSSHFQSPVPVESFLYPVETDPVQLELYMAAIASGNVRFVCAVCVCVCICVVLVFSISTAGLSGAQSFTS